ncbi:MAG: TonB-dependent siderophore receptor [Betaproteobacteria bacterium]|nr:TonB-dependent siderophore receptor [Betaproteobacteria bacterium]
MSFSATIKPAAIAALAALVTAGTAHAAEPTLPQVNVQAQPERADGPVDGYRAKRSATFTKTDTPLKEVPASVSVVPAQLMKDQAMQSMGDVIRYVPGAIHHQGEGNRDQFILRGISTTADLYVDGIRDDAQVFRDLYDLERVEVLKGAGGMIFGRGGAGGVVNRVTKKPVFGHVGEASVSLGSYSQLRGSVDVGRKINDSAAWRLNAMAENGNSFRDGFDMKRYAVNPTVALIPSAQTSLTLGIEHLHDERTADRGFPAQNGRPFNVGSSTFFGNAGQSDARSTVDGLYAILDHDFGGVQLKNSFRVTYYDKFYQNVYPDNANASSVTAADTMRLAAYNNANQRTNVFNQTDLTTNYNAGGLEHTLLAGLELGHQDSTGRRNTGFFGAATLATVPASAPFALATSFRPNGTDADNNVNADIAALYLQDQIALSKEWKLLAGLRYDHFKTTFDDRRTTTPPTDLARTDNEWSPRLGLIWSPNPASTYYASYSYSFLPSGEQLSLAPNTADLAPEKAKNYEIGGRWDLLPKLTLSAALFRLDRDDVRSPDPLNPGFFVKTGQQRTEGIEIGLQGEITRNWQVYAGYAHLNGRITERTSAAVAGARLQLLPENTLSVWNRFDVGNGWGAGLGVVYQADSFATLDNVVTLPAFTRTDGAIYYTFAGGKTRLALNLENLFDRKYFPTADGNNNISPGAPRNARLTLSTAF